MKPVAPSRLSKIPRSGANRRKARLTAGQARMGVVIHFKDSHQNSTFQNYPGFKKRARRGFCLL